MAGPRTGGGARRVPGSLGPPPITLSAMWPHQGPCSEQLGGSPGLLPPQTARLRRLAGPPEIPAVVGRGLHTLPAPPGPCAQQPICSDLKPTPSHRAALSCGGREGRGAAGTPRAQPIPDTAWQT